MIPESLDMVFQDINSKKVYEMEQIVNLIMNNGMAVVLMAYFLWKDWKISTQQIELLTQIKEMLLAIKKEG